MNSLTGAEPSLSSRAMLCSLSISTWSARKHDPEASEEIAQRHGAQADAGRYQSADRGETQKQILRGVYPERARARFFASLRMTANGLRMTAKGSE
jgi:hypothetical protein